MYILKAMLMGGLLGIVPGMVLGRACANKWYIKESTESKDGKGFVRFISVRDGIRIGMVHGFIVGLIVGVMWAIYEAVIQYKR